ncbi:PAS domain S-box-containing protein [Burkholderia sp. WP9]|uniref:sensor histidine kinase n=1 Tax=Burkholderia sp. WP9 TaxID=1500263 RepID=UPI00089A5F90|nr:ATP-binding protein [Burkholderia sp. WP9]SEC87954.1 PAS domain S-box-containing protein [Burkholderia sp. WP9]
MDSRHQDSSSPSHQFDAAVAFEALPDAYLILNHRYEILLANARYLDLTGQSLSDLQGKSILDVNQFGPAEQREARRAWLIGALRDLSPGGSKWSPLFRYEMPEHRDAKPNGEAAGELRVPRYWKIKASLLGARHGQGGTIALRVSEVTERVSDYERDQRERAKLRSQAQLRQLLADEAKAQLREHQERFQIAMAFSQLGAWELDPVTGAIECTDQCKSNLGLDSNALLTEQRLFGEVVHPEDRSRLRDAMNHALAAHDHFEVDFRIGWASGAVRWILVRGVGRFLPDGTLSSVIGFTLDITSRKEAELEQREIAASEKRAREHSERLAMAMDHFVTTVSHELRSPLSAIISWTDLLQRAADPSHLARATGVISRNARQLSHMVDDLLDSGAIVTGKLSVNLQPVDLGALAGIVVEDMRMHAEAKGLRLIADDLTSAMVLADEGRMKQVVWNLVSNAVKFSAQGTIELSVRADGERVELAVRDTGLGLDGESLERIFDRFQQFGADGSGRVAGLGLGLWLVKNLVDLHGGTITAESPGLGQGATFRVRLPAYR